MLPLHVLGWRPFLEPMPRIWAYWPWLLAPLIAAVAIVYKSMKCESMKRVPRESAIIALWIFAGLGGAAVALAVLVRFIDWTRS